MKALLLCSVLLFSTSVLAQAPDPSTDSVARLVFQYIKSGNWQQIHQLCDSTFRARVPLAMFAGQFSQLQRTALGNIQSLTFDRRQNRSHFYKARFDESSLSLILTLNDADSISGFALRKYFVPGQDTSIKSSNKLQTATDKKVDSVVRAYIRTSYAAGISIGILSNGTTSFYGYGETKRGTGTVPVANSLFEIGSISKTFTALLLALEVKRGNIHLDSCISIYLPASLPRMEWKGKPISVQMLSNHTSGIPSLPLNFKTISGYNNDDPYHGYAKELLYQYLQSFTPYREPGKAHEYSNMGVALLGNILEDKQGKSWSDLVHQQITKRLKMKQTGQFSERIKKVNYTACYNGVGEEARPWTFQAFAPAGALHSTTADLLKYAAFVMKPGTGDLAAALDVTLQPTFTVSSTTKIGLGWYLFTSKGRQYITHSGGTGGYRSTLVIDRTSQKAVVVLSNTANEVETIAFQLIEYLNAQ